MTMSSNGEEHDGYTPPFRKSDRKYTYLPRSRSMNDLPGGIRVPVVQRSDSRLKDRLEASLAGLEELKILRESHQKLFEEAREISSQTLRHANSSSELSTYQKQERGRRLSRRYSTCSLTGIQEESQNAPPREQPNSAMRSRKVGVVSMNETGYSLRSRCRRPLSISDAETLEQTLRQPDTLTSTDSIIPTNVSDCKQNKLESGELTQGMSPNEHLETRPSQVQDGQENKSPTRSGLTRRSSIQCEAILTGTSVCPSNPNILSGVNLQCAFPSPLHAVLMQYGNKEKEVSQRRHSTVEHRSDKFSRFLQLQDNNNTVHADNGKLKRDMILHDQGQNISESRVQNGTESPNNVFQDKENRSANDTSKSNEEPSSDSIKTCEKLRTHPSCNRRKSSPPVIYESVSDDSGEATVCDDKTISDGCTNSSLAISDEIPISRLTINNINRYNSMFSDQPFSHQKSQLKHLKRQMSLDSISEKCPDYIPNIADEKFRKMSQPSNFYSQLSKQTSKSEMVRRCSVNESRHSAHSDRADGSSDCTEHKSFLSDEGYCPSIPSTPRGHKLSLVSDYSWISADIDESTSNCDLSAISKQDDDKSICDKENIDLFSRRRSQTRCDDINNYGAKNVDDAVGKSMEESLHKTFKQTSV